MGYRRLSKLENQELIDIQKRIMNAFDAVVERSNRRFNELCVCVSEAVLDGITGTRQDGGKVKGNNGSE